jgi:Multiubiquitin
MSEEFAEVEDVADAVREGRALRPALTYRIRVAQDGLDFRAVDVADPVPLGRQILGAAGLKPIEAFSLFGILHSGDFEDVRLDEPFDLRERGTERFVAFQTDRTSVDTQNRQLIDTSKPAIN